MELLEYIKMDKKYIVGNAKTNLDNPITKNYNKFFLAFIVSDKDDIILETEYHLS